ncbi:signal recognition particle, SRP19 subunit [Gaertneriomyces semiglobifer]|nr:signal recognition particle, SRP19 subunit [Gaertneriomyces semiglobifer]
MDPDDIDNMDFDLPVHLMQQSQGAGPSGASSSTSLPEGHRPPRNAPADAAIKQAAKSWTAVYPVYIDATRPHRLGRRLPKELCSASPPSIVYMTECVRMLGLPCLVDTEKRHPADPLVMGRLKVQIKNLTTNAPLNARIRTKMDLLKEIARVYDQVEQAVNEGDPKMVAMAAASRSEISKNIKELVKESSTPPAASKKKGKKK